MSNVKEAIEEQNTNEPMEPSAEATEKKAPTNSSAKELAAPVEVQLEAPEPQAYPIAAFRWREINAQGDKVLEQAHRVEQLGKTLGVMWKELETLPFGNVVDPIK